MSRRLVFAVSTGPAMATAPRTGMCVSYAVWLSMGAHGPTHDANYSAKMASDNDKDVQHQARYMQAILALLSNAADVQR